jgi:hypothetical protein
MKTKEGYDRDWGCHFLSRRDHDGKIIKFTIPEADAEGEIFMPSDRSAKNFGDGMGFSPNGDLYVLTDIRRYPSVEFKGRPGPSVIVYDAEGNQKPYRKTVFVGNAEPRKSFDRDGNESEDFGRLVQVPSGGSCGIGADRFGNFYVGSNSRPLASGEERVFLPEDLAGSPAVMEGSPLRRWLIDYAGSVIKFSPKGATLSSQGDPTHWYWGNGSQVRFVRLDPVLWTFVGVTPITTKTMGCICQQARISVDGWGRVLVPQTHRQSILILDSNANTVLRVGSFGTLGSKGRRIYFTTPKYCGASDTALYVADRALGRVVKADLSYAVEETVALR